MSTRADALAIAPTAAPRAPGQAAPPAPLRFGAFAISETHAFPPPTGPCCWVYVTLNAEIAMSLPHSDALQQLVDSPRARFSIDGQWLWWALRRKYPGQPLAKLSGSDLIYTVAEHCAARGGRLLLLGGRADVNAAAVAALAHHAPALQVCGAALPFYAEGSEAEGDVQAQTIELIRARQPDFVVFGLGAGKEHRLAAAIAPQLDGQVAGLLCFGGAIDIAGGAYRRAPRAWQRAGLEGLYRVWQHPARAARLARVLRILPRLAAGRY